MSQPISNFDPPAEHQDLIEQAMTHYYASEFDKARAIADVLLAAWHLRIIPPCTSLASSPRRKTAFRKPRNC